MKVLVPSPNEQPSSSKYFSQADSDIGKERTQISRPLELQILIKGEQSYETPLYKENFRSYP